MQNIKNLEETIATSGCFILIWCAQNYILLETAEKLFLTSSLFLIKFISQFVHNFDRRDIKQKKHANC